MKTKGRSVSDRVVVWIVILYCWFNSQPGVDHGQYLKWGRAFAESDPLVLENDCGLKSPTGLPFSPWSAGPGMLIAPFHQILEPLGLENGAGMICGYLCVPVFWFSSFFAFRLLAGRFWANVGVLFLAIGTPAGYYCSSISSETFALTAAAFLAWQTMESLFAKTGSGRIRLAGIAAATGVLLMTRSFLGVFAWPALLATWWRTERKMEFGVLSTLSVALAVGQILAVNWAMTGSALLSPYSFGDEYFRSFDSSAPYWKHVLFDPFHGLVLSHPLVALGLIAQAAVVGICLKAGRILEAMVWILFLTACGLNIYVQSCWFYWWMAISSFGMRGLVLCSLPSALATIRVLAIFRAEPHGKPYSFGFGILLVFSVVCSCWGWLNLCAGVTNCTTLMDLGSDLAQAGTSWFDLPGLLALVTAVLLTRFISSVMFPGDSLHQGSDDRSEGANSTRLGPGIRTNRCFLMLMIFLLLSLLVRNLIESPPAGILLLISAIVFCAGVVTGMADRRRLSAVLSTGWAVALVLMMGYFGNLAWVTASSRQDRFDRQAAMVNSEHSETTEPKSFNWPDARRAYLTLRQIPRFSSQAAQIRRFFERNYSTEFVNRELPLEYSESNPSLRVSRR